jgi:aldehyde:ferredoxin oxidoreductase
LYTYYLIVVDSLPSCVWGSPAWYNLYTDDHVGYLTQLSDTYTAVTGIESTEADIRKIGERIWNLERAIRVREGRTRKDDWGWMDETADGAQELKEALEIYYAESGWDKDTGWPTRAKLEELGLKDIADGLAKLGKLP